MNRKQLLNKLDYLYARKSINTNNDWGFGGSVKIRYYVDDLFVDVGFACYRHLPRTSFINIKDEHGHILCEGTKDVVNYLKNNKLIS